MIDPDNSTEEKETYQRIDFSDAEQSPLKTEQTTNIHRY